MTQTPSTPDEIVALSASDFEVIKQACLDDPWVFAKVVCSREKQNDWFHKPLLYLNTGQGERLVAMLNDRDAVKRSFVLQELAHQLIDIHSVDWNSFAGYQRFAELLDFVNIRIFRGSGKSSIGQDAILWDITRDPNNTILLVSASDDRALSFSAQIKTIILSDLYRALFPERIPSEIKPNITESWIKLAGRTINSPQPCLEAYGYKSTVIGAHYNKFDIDDLMTETNVYDVDGIRRFLSGMAGLQMPMRIMRRHRGTVWDENDDGAMLRTIPHCLSLVVPIEVYDGPIENLNDRGTPTLDDPNWWESDTVSAIKKKLAETLADPMQGPRSWRMNYLLDPTAGGGRLFPAHVLERSVWKRFPEQKGEKFVIGVPVFDKEGQALKDDEGSALFRAIKPSELTIVLGCDQAFSKEETSDEWAVVALGQHQSGKIIELELFHGHGYEGMLDSLLFANEKWKPAKIGIEKASMQESTMWWIDQHHEFRRLRSKIVPMPHANIGKAVRIQNMVAEPMKSGELFLSPEDMALRDQMAKFKPGDRKAKDDLIDAVAIGMALLKRPPSAKTKEDVKRFDAKVRAMTDQNTGIFLG